MGICTYPYRGLGGEPASRSVRGRHLCIGYQPDPKKKKKQKGFGKNKKEDGRRKGSQPIDHYANLLHCSVVQISRVSHPDSAPTWTEMKMGRLKGGIALSTGYLVGYAHIERMLVGIANSRSALGPPWFFLFFFFFFFSLSLS